MSLYRGRLEVKIGSMGYTSTDVYYSKWYSSLKELEEYWPKFIGSIEKESFERRRESFIEESNED